MNEAFEDESKDILEEIIEARIEERIEEMLKHKTEFLNFEERIEEMLKHKTELLNFEEDVQQVLTYIKCNNEARLPKQGLIQIEVSAEVSPLLLNNFPLI